MLCVVCVNSKTGYFIDKQGAGVYFSGQVICSAMFFFFLSLFVLRIPRDAGVFSRYLFLLLFTVFWCLVLAFQTKGWIDRLVFLLHSRQEGDVESINTVLQGLYLGV